MKDSSSIIPILHILESDTDSDHFLTCRQIIYKVQQQTGLHITRQRFYITIHELIELGYEISTYSENRKGYFMIQHTFEDGEVYCLLHAIHSCPSITSEQSKALEDKCLDLLPEYKRSNFIHEAYLEVSRRTDNPEVMINIELITEAITERKQISFDYYHNRPRQGQVINKKPFAEVKPKYIVYRDNKAYLYATCSVFSGISHFRVDRIRNLKISATSFSCDDEIDAYKYSEKDLFMFSGSKSHVTFRCCNSVLDHLIDEIGTNIKEKIIDSNHFEITIYCSDQNALILAQKYIDSIVITSPKRLRQIMYNQIVTAMNDYKD